MGERTIERGDEENIGTDLVTRTCTCGESQSQEAADELGASRLECRTTDQLSGMHRGGTGLPL